jgi:excisionase family DNA binding protein
MDNPFDLILNRLNAIQNKVGEIETFLQTNPLNTEPAKDELLNIKQAALLLGLSVPTIYSKVSKTEIPVSKQGNRLYFSRQELTEWIKTGRKKTINEIQADTNTYLQAKKRRG